MWFAEVKLCLALFWWLWSASETFINFSGGRIISSAEMDGFWWTDLKAVAVFCNRSNLSAFGQSMLSYSEFPVSGLKAAYFEAYSGILQNKKVLYPLYCFAYVICLKEPVRWWLLLIGTKLSSSHCPVLWFVRPCALTHSYSHLHSTVVCLDHWEVFKNKNKNTISLCCFQTYPQSMEGMMSTKASCLIAMYAQSFLWMSMGQKLSLFWNLISWGSDANITPE